MGTYVLSLSFFEAILLPTLRQAGVRSITLLSDIEGVAGALGEAGARDVGRGYGLHPLRVRGGVFHPKFMLLDGPEGPSAVVGSGNLTFGGWGHNLELCEILRPDRSGQAILDIADFLDELAYSDRVTGVDMDALAIWAARLRSTAPSGEARIIHNVRSPIADQLIEMASDLGTATRLTIASPYYGNAGAVDALAKALGDPRVEIHVHDGEQLAANGHHFPFAQSPDRSPISLDAFAGEGAGPLHAKLIEIECELGALLATGSVNASTPALAQTGNVELAVTRILDVIQPRTRADIPTPIPMRKVETQTGASFGILRATLLGTSLKGSVLSPATPGAWHAEFDHDGVMHDLGVLEISAEGHFESKVMVADASYGRRRSTLVLRRGETQLRGFVSFPDALELNTRWGAAAGPFIRVAGGSDDDEDLAGLLEYFASNPRDTASPWRRPSKVAAPRDMSGRLIALSELDIREAQDEMGEDHLGAPSRSALNRIIAAFRLRATSPAGHGRGATDEHVEIEDEGEEEQDKRSNARVLRAFDELLDVLETRVPLDPAVELQRAGEIAGFVLLRNPEPVRIGDFARWWTGLAIAHLKGDHINDELRIMAAGMLALEGIITSGAERSRGRIAHVLGDVETALKIARAIDPNSRLRRLVEVVAGANGLSAFADAVGKASSVVEEVIIAADHITRGLTPPPLPLLDDSEEMQTVRRHVRNGDIGKIIAAQRHFTACPRCHYGLPQAERLRLASIGLARAANCCNRVMMVGID
ncbi:phospholipase D-like domain-containing protein [Sphingobium yanoikuyae]|uniref:hypothetical protein n=1 Tax=Sphingobium yanoikuyae TaxID=13690 RepID=UPI00123766DD|nr:hypothetical protein [Sphingobium yanoikuyae]